MANSINFTDWLSMEALRILQNKCVMAEYFNTDYNKEFEREYAVGETVRVPIPQRWLIRDGLAYSEQPINRIFTTVACDQVIGIDFGYDSVEEALKLERSREQISKQYLEPVMIQLAQEIDSRCANFAMLNTNNIVGQLGTNPVTLSPYGIARQRLVENACPPGEKAMIISPGMMEAITDSTTSPAPATFFHPGDEVKRAFKEGYYERAKGFDWYDSMSLYSQTAGTWAGAVTVAAGGAVTNGGTLLNVACTNGDTFNAGDVFNIALVNNANPVTRRTTGTLKQFVVQISVTGASSAAALTFLPAINGPGSQYQNVDALPVVGQALTLFPGTTSPNGKTGINGLALHRDAFSLVGVKLKNPKAVEIATQARDPISGLSIAMVKAFDPIGRRMIHRWDCLFGFGALYSDNCAVRVLSQT